MLMSAQGTFSKHVFGVSKTSISGFVAVGPHCNFCFSYNMTSPTVERCRRDADGKCSIMS